MITLIIFILVVYIGGYIFLLHVINKQKHRIHELSEMNDSLNKELNSMLCKNFKNNIKLFREGMGYTQDELAYLVGISRNSICSLEHQDFQPSVYTAYKLCLCLGVTFEQLFYWED